MNRRMLAATVTGALLLSAPLQAVAANKNSKFCKTAKTIDSSDLFGDDFDPTENPKEGLKQLKEGSKLLKQLEGESPSSVKGDVKGIREFFDSFAKILPNLPTGSKTPDPKKLAAVLGDLQKLTADTAKLEARTTKLKKFLLSECGIKTS